MKAFQRRCNERTCAQHHVCMCLNELHIAISFVGYAWQPNAGYPFHSHTHTNTANRIHWINAFDFLEISRNIDGQHQKSPKILSILWFNHFQWIKWFPKNLTIVPSVTRKRWIDSHTFWGYFNLSHGKFFFSLSSSFQ